MKRYPKYHLINLVLLTYAGDLKNLKKIENYENYTFIKGDTRDRSVVEDIFDKYDIGGRNEKINLQVVDSICAVLDKKVPKNLLIKS